MPSRRYWIDGSHRVTVNYLCGFCGVFVDVFVYLLFGIFKTTCGAFQFENLFGFDGSQFLEGMVIINRLECGYWYVFSSKIKASMDLDWWSRLGRQLFKNSSFEFVLVIFWLVWYPCWRLWIVQLFFECFS